MASRKVNSRSRRINKIRFASGILSCFFHCRWRCFSGKIACANVLSDLYAMGVTECDNMLMLLGVSTKMTEKERDVVVPLIMRGFKDSALEAGTTVTGGQTVVNPWCTIGGVATTVCQPNEYIVYVSKDIGIHNEVLY